MITSHWFQRARKAWSSTRKRMTARLMPRFTPPDQNEISIGDWKLRNVAYAAGFRRIGIAPLFGLAEWRSEAIALAEHVEYLLKKCWRSHLTVSLPRLRPAAGGFRPHYSFADRDLIQVLCALRITFPQVGIVLSTRESSDFRDALMPIGVTMMSAGSRTEPGGYTGQGTHSLHLTVKGRVTQTTCGADSKAGGQFEVEDNRSPDEVAAALRANGLEPVWKDWDSAILSAMKLTLNGQARDLASRHDSLRSPDFAAIGRENWF